MSQTQIDPVPKKHLAKSRHKNSMRRQRLAKEGKCWICQEPVTMHDRDTPAAMCAKHLAEFRSRDSSRREARRALYGTCTPRSRKKKAG